MITQNKVKNYMTENPFIIDEEQTLEQAAKKMQEIDCGILPVGTAEKVAGILTDRDIVIRAVVRGQDPKKIKVKDCMSKQAWTVAETATLEEAAALMARHKVSRLLVTDDATGRITGILTFGGILRNAPTAHQLEGVIDQALQKKAA